MSYAHIIGHTTFVLNCNFLENMFSGHSTFVQSTIDISFTCISINWQWRSPRLGDSGWRVGFSRLNWLQCTACTWSPRHTGQHCRRSLTANIVGRQCWPTTSNYYASTRDYIDRLYNPRPALSTTVIDKSKICSNNVNKTRPAVQLLALNILRHVL